MCIRDRPGPIYIEEEDTLLPEDTKLFMSTTGSHLYLSRRTRSDITHSVTVLTKSMSKPDPRAMTQLKQVLMYLKGTVSIGITYSEDAEDSRHTLTQTTQVTRTRDTRLLELLSIWQVAQ